MTDFTTPMKRAWLSLSLAMIVLSPYWLLSFSYLSTPFDRLFLGNHYHSPLDNNHIDYISALVLTLVIGIALYVWFGLIGRRRGRVLALIADLFCVVAVLFMLNSVRIYYGSSPEAIADWLPVSFATATKAALALFAVTVVLFFKRLMPLFWLGVSVFAPVGVVILGNVGAAVVFLAANGGEALRYDRTLRPRHTDSGRRTRVLWMIFDELDQRLALERRPKGVELPVLDHFRSEAIQAAAAYSPAENTHTSMPGLIAGRVVVSAVPSRANELMITFEGEREAVPWSLQPNVFRRAAENGANVAVVAQSGHPYCRLFHRWASTCWENGRPWDNTPRTVWNRLDDVVMILLQHLPFVYRAFGFAPKTEYHSIAGANSYLRMLDGGGAAAADPANDFVFIHWNHPHRPFFYDRFTDRFVSRPETPLGYIDQLELVDRTLRTIEAALRRSGLWDRTAIIISADHSWRKSKLYDGKRDLRVPFIIKLPGRRDSIMLSDRIETVNTHRLISAILEGQRLEPEDIGAILIRRP